MPSPCCETCKVTCGEGEKCGKECKCAADCQCCGEATTDSTPKCQCKGDGECGCPEGACTCK